MNKNNKISDISMSHTNIFMSRTNDFLYEVKLKIFKTKTIFKIVLYVYLWATLNNKINLHNKISYILMSQTNIFYVTH